MPATLYFIAYVIGFYHFRVQECEGLYALMEKVGHLHKYQTYFEKFPDAIFHKLYIDIINCSLLKGYFLV